MNENNREEMQIYIEEIARVALEDTKIKSYIGHELDLSDEELDRVLAYLEVLWQKDMSVLKGVNE
jgi:hypothetical protein